MITGLIGQVGFAVDGDVLHIAIIATPDRHAPRIQLKLCPKKMRTQRNILRARKPTSPGESMSPDGSPGEDKLAGESVSLDLGRPMMTSPGESMSPDGGFPMTSPGGSMPPDPSVETKIDERIERVTGMRLPEGKFAMFLFNH